MCSTDRGRRGSSIEAYVHDHSEAEFSHGICPDCLKKLYPDLPILALTANAAEEDRAACLQVGMSDLVAKPVTSKGLRQALGAIFGKKNGQLEG